MTKLGIRDAVLALATLAALLFVFTGCRWSAGVQSELTVHQPTAQVGLQPQDGDK